MSNKKHVLGKHAGKQKQVRKPLPKAQNTNSRPGIRSGYTFAALALLTFIVFYPSLRCGFTNWDDGTYITENPLIWSLDWKTIRDIFITPVSLNYHPLTVLSLALDYKIGKFDPYYYHLTNVLLHILNTFLTFIFIRLFIGAYNNRVSADTFRPDPFNLALIVSVLFAIHPMRVESVTWVAERKDVLYVFFFFLSLIFYLRGVERKGNSGMFFCFIFFICSCLSKGMGVVLPVILVLIDRFLDVGSFANNATGTLKQFSQSVLKKAHFFLIALLFGVIAYEIQSHGAIAALETFSLFQRLTFGSYGFIMYLVKLIAPVNLSAFYPYPFTDLHGNIPGIYYASPFIVLAIAATVFIVFKRNNTMGKFFVFGFLFYFTTIVLVLQFLSVGSVIMADRYSYLAYVGLFLIIGYLFEYCRTFFPSPITRFFTVFLLLATTICSYLTHERVKVWTNAETLWTDAMNQFPFIEIAYENRGIYYKDHNELDKMLKDYEFVTEQLHSKNEKIWSNLGNLYGLQKKFDKSLNAYSKAIEYNPNNASTYLNRAITLSMMGQYSKSIPDYDRAIVLEPKVALTYKNRAYTLLQLGQFDKSINDYDKAIELYSYDTLSYFNRGISKFNAKKFQEAIVDFTKYIEMNPNNPQAYYNASMAYKNINMFSEALINAQKAQERGLSINPEYIKELQSKIK
jgi:protein O-mannosyl-transferase